jgi:hypothetical protein
MRNGLKLPRRKVKKGRGKTGEVKELGKREFFKSSSFPPPLFFLLLTDSKCSTLDDSIWEKKYGQAAAHVVKASGGKPLPVDKLKKNKKLLKAGEPVTYSIKSSSNNNTIKTVPTEEDKPFNPANAPGGSANPNAQPIAPRKVGYGQQGQPTSTTTTATGEKMHPSWEAKRKQAEALKQTQPQGKKITFD